MKMATATKAKAKAAAAVPKGMKQITGGYANSWNVEELPVLDGMVNNPPKTVKLVQNKKEVDRLCVEVRTEDEQRYTVWESAGLVAFFDALKEKDLPCRVWISFTGYGKAKKGQNPPKLFESAIE